MSLERLSALPDTIRLATFTFDRHGAADTQGWTTHDLTAQPDTFFHVADATELDGGQSGSLVPLQGNQSLWCGIAPSSESPYCGYATLPGYGNLWETRFESVAFPVLGNVTVSYRVRWDSEPEYDRTTVEYQDTGGEWVTLPVNGGAGYYVEAGDLTESFSISSQSVGGSLRLRFHFRSDGLWSDEDGRWPTDGAILVDSLRIVDATGTVDFQDFEMESPGSRTTADGDWMAKPGPAFGDFAALYSGPTVLQEDPCRRIINHLWGFFDDPSITYYYCWPWHPEQGAIRYGEWIGPEWDDCLDIQNEIWSPPIPFAGSGDVVNLSFLVYRDLPFDGALFYYWRVRSWVDGECVGPWKNYSTLYYGSQKDWATITVSIGGFIDPGATHIQVALGVKDLSSIWCGYGCGDAECCHTHAPLFDNVRVDRVNLVGPQLTVDHGDLFQDNFAQDGTLTGTARVDCARDVAGPYTATIRPGDSLSVHVRDLSGDLAADPFTGVGPSVYAYVSIRPDDQAGKSGPDLEAPETGAYGKRFPLVDSLAYGGATWFCFRMDSVRTGSGVVADRYCFDMNDGVVTPGDTIFYVLGGEGSSGNRTYWSRRMRGQGENLVTNDLWEALASPCEFTILPAGGYARGGDILFVDVSDDRGGPIQLFFDTAFDALGLGGLVDRYDVLGPTSRLTNNSLASRVRNVSTQITGCYRTIIWCSGDLASATISNGSGVSQKADDYALLFDFLDAHLDNPGLYLSGDDLAYNWVMSDGPEAVRLKTVYMNFSTAGGDHVLRGEPVSPLLVLDGSCFGGDTLIALGGCPVINDFDVLQPAGISVSQADYPNGGGTAILSQATPNPYGTVARVVLSGFSYDYIRDVASGFPPARVEHLHDILAWFQNIAGPPTGVEPPPQFANFLDCAYPNPFNPSATIRYGIEDQGHVSMKIYSVGGELVRTLVDEVQSPQTQGFVVRWDGRSDAGEWVASGVYFYRLQARGFAQTRKIVLLR